MQSLLILAHAENPTEIISFICTHAYTHTHKEEEKKIVKRNHLIQMNYFLMIIIRLPFHLTSFNLKIKI